MSNISNGCINAVDELLALHKKCVRKGYKNKFGREVGRLEYCFHCTEEFFEPWPCETVEIINRNLGA